MLDRLFHRGVVAAVILFVSLAGAPGGGAAATAELAEPPVFASINHVLDLLIVARPEPVDLDPFRVTGWVYDICRRPARGNSCPARSVSHYGGTRLQLAKGDTLKIRLVNKLPPDVGSKHQYDPGFEYLVLNPTNLHTHGMLVSPHFPTLTNPTYGDNVFVFTLNRANGPPPAGSYLHGLDLRYGFTDYEIKIPRSHPSGLFWFHPHAYGISSNQISAGMAGIITVGQPSDYICTTACGVPANLPVRHLILKDTQVVPPGVLQDQEDPLFCDLRRAPQDPARRGACLATAGTGTGRDRGRWFFTVNGQQYPNVTVRAPLGEIWRITNASASITYKLQLRDRLTNRNMLMQIVAIDGVSVTPDDGKPSCPRSGSQAPTGALCVRELMMFPSSRVEVWVTYRDADDLPARPPAGARAVLRQAGMQTGPGGDAWPQVDLAAVRFADGGVRSSPMPPALAVNGEARALAEPVQIAKELAADSRAFPAAPACKPLPAGHSRRIFFNSIPAKIESGPQPAEGGEGGRFGLGYEELDENGKPVPGTFVDVSVFDFTTPQLCLPLGPHNTPVKERWQLVNLSAEDHNFHIHQTKFRLLSQDVVDGDTVPKGDGVLHDNVPVGHADGTCNAVADWRAGKCRAHPVWVEIPFSIAGNYVYHCHILEHEDGGMMAHIRVRASP